MVPSLLVALASRRARGLGFGFGVLLHSDLCVFLPGACCVPGSLPLVSLFSLTMEYFLEVSRQAVTLFPEFKSAC